ncbi:MAG: heavy-metal-associated domain-containing protein, partial [Candidatus Bipolaricaulaceae bacterium]
MLERRSFPVRGMTCAACVAHVERALARLPGVKEVQVNLAAEKATVVVEEKLPWADLVRAVQETGYEVPTETVVLPIGGMTCAACVA